MCFTVFCQIKVICNKELVVVLPITLCETVFGEAYKVNGIVNDMLCLLQTKKRS